MNVYDILTPKAKQAQLHILTDWCL